MSAGLLAVVMIIYAAVAVNEGRLGKADDFIIFFGYAFSLIGFIMKAWR